MCLIRGKRYGWKRHGTVALTVNSATPMAMANAADGGGEGTGNVTPGVVECGGIRIRSN